MATDVFVSVGRPTTPEQNEFVAALERCLADDHDLHPRTLGRNEWSSEQPLRAIKKRMQSCSGAAVIAFERLHAAAARDRGRDPDDNEIGPLALTTVWNQIEAAMAYTLGLPILVLAEEGLRSEGLLEERYDWTVEWVPTKSEVFNEPRCRGIIGDWAKRVHHGGRPTHTYSYGDMAEKDLGEMTIAELLGELKPGQARALLGGTVASLAALSSGAFALGMTIAGG